MPSKHLIVGLGNPGSKYKNTRHNIGFRVIDELVARYRLGVGRSDKSAHCWDGRIKDVPVKLATPLTYMNRSGESVRQLVDYYDIPLSQLLVIHDDLDTPFGMLRLRPTGGHGGQNGLRSLIQHLGGKDFARLRFGIGRPPGKMDPVNYVLQSLRGDDAIRARELAGRAADAAEIWLSEGIQLAMSRFNGDAINAQGTPNTRDLAEQLAIAVRAHELAPSATKPLMKLIALQKRSGLIDDAVANHLLLARLLHSQGNDELSIAEKVKAVSIRPSLIAEQREIAGWYLAHENTKRAVNRYLILAQHLLEQTNRTAALDAVEQALSINPQHPKALEMRRALLDTFPSQ